MRACVGACVRGCMHACVCVCVCVCACVQGLINPVTCDRVEIGAVSIVGLLLLYEVKLSTYCSLLLWLCTSVSTTHFTEEVLLASALIYLQICMKVNVR